MIGMKKWAAYLDRLATSDLWGCVLLDCYYQKPPGQKESAVQFVKGVLPRLLKGQSDPVAFHRVLVCVCVQLLERDFKNIFALSLFFLQKLAKKPAPEELLEIIGHYVPYGKEQGFAAILLRSRGITTGAAMKDKLEEYAKVERTARSVDMIKKKELGDLNRRVLSALARAATTADRDSVSTSQEYVESFRSSGKMKGEAFVDQLTTKYPKFNDKRIAIVSVGGAEGTEIAHILRTTEMRYGILLERDATALEYAQSKPGELASVGKTLSILSGDVKDTIKLCNKRLREWRDGKLIDGVAYSINSTLHELPTRGAQKFDLRHFLNQVVGDWKPFMIAVREPCKAVDWPNRVELKCPGLLPENLELLAINVGERLRLTERTNIKTMPDEFVAMPSRVAVEVLFKLFHLEAYEYEIQESVTAIDPRKLKRALQEVLKTNLEAVYANSVSFGELYEQYGISCRSSSSQTPESKPTVFVSIIGKRV